ncbi:hypothetical protein [Roseinatronobacter sp.]
MVRFSTPAGIDAEIFSMGLLHLHNDPVLARFPVILRPTPAIKG